MGWTQTVGSEACIKHMSHDKAEDPKTDKNTFNTQGNGKADESAKLGADMDKASRTEWLAGEMQYEREKRKGMYHVRPAFSLKMMAQ